MRIKSLLTLTVASFAMLGTMAVPSHAAFISICPVATSVDFDPELTLTTNLATPHTAVVHNTALLGLCRRINDNGTVEIIEPAPVLPGTATGGCVLAVLDGDFFQGVLVGGSVWVTVDQGDGFILAVATKVLIPDVICDEAVGTGFGVGVLVG